MRTKTIILLVLFVITQYIFAQKVVEKNITVENMEKDEHIYGIDGTHLLEKHESAVTRFLKENPDCSENQRLNKPNAWNFSVGSTKNWWAWDYLTDVAPAGFYLISSTCRAVGTNCYIFVENSQWETRITQSEIDAIREAFDNQTPANPSKGIYQTNVETFGVTPNIDNDPKIIILLLDIKDGFNGSGGYVAGYFYAVNQYLNNNLSPDYRYSNEADMFYMDTYPANQVELQRRLATLAHEFQHMIHWNYHKDPPNLTFINEGCSLAAEVINGYPLREQTSYANRTNRDLYVWGSSLSDEVFSDYSRAAKLTFYLYEQFGIEILKHIVQTRLLGTETYPDALSKSGVNITFNQVLQNWFIANALNDRTIKEEWGYLYDPIVKPAGKQHYNPNTNSGGILEPYAVEYVSFLSGEGLEVDFSTRSTSLIIKAIKEGLDKKEIIDIKPGVKFSEPEFGSTYTKITFIVMNPTGTIEQSYSIIAKGNISEVVEPKPSYFKLEQNYPNPFNPSTNIQFTLEKAGMTKLSVYDMLGRELTTLINEKKNAGTYEVTFNAHNYASGIYYYKLQNNNVLQIKKMMLLK